MPVSIEPLRSAKDKEDDEALQFVHLSRDDEEEEEVDMELASDAEVEPRQKKQRVV